MLKKLHHVAYRCRDAAETVDFYTNALGMKFAGALVQDKVPSIGLDAPHTHIFFELEDGSYIAFFEILGSKEPLVPVKDDWAQHLALEVESDERAEAISARLKARGVEVIGPVTHGEMARSWYFYDPSGHRMEMAVRAETDRVSWGNLAKTAYDDLAKWESRKGKGTAKPRPSAR